MYLLSHQPSLIPKIMESLAPTHLLLLLFTLFTFIATISCTESISNPIQDDIHDIVCSVPGVNCAQGKCKYSNDSSHSIDVPGLGRVGFDCDCNPGWKKIQIGPFTYPSCLIPDCTVNVGCDLSPPQPPPFPPPLVIPQCALVWCGDGTCIANGTSGYICQCNEGTLNMLDNPQLACLKTCAFGGDCKKLGFPSDAKSNAPSSQTIVTMMLLTSIFLTWI
ncbi:uncharacterized protein LOC133739535 [Rosa rugosa]|uniref:uncharacterized protein LOC133739535 n=1 Tax=Rosa rugosa TaxID=74645 RepID=UPI002B40F401|nr:uncharacterized protein LOC133739535 [Rosa rugosa]